jgi:hypothetical protein
VQVSAGVEMRELARSQILRRKLSGLKNPNHNPRTAYIGQKSDKRDDKSLHEVEFPQHSSQHEELVYELELHEHDFQPFDVR